MTRRILVTGSRLWADVVTMRAVLSVEFQKDPAAILVHGGAKGADLMSGAIWKQFGGTTEVHEADWGKWGRSAGYRRNGDMVNLGADICLVFQAKPNDETKGTKQCMEAAQKKGIHTRLIFPSDVQIIPVSKPPLRMPKPLRKTRT